MRKFLVLSVFKVPGISGAYTPEVHWSVLKTRFNGTAGAAANTEVRGRTSIMRWLLPKRVLFRAVTDHKWWRIMLVCVYPVGSRVKDVSYTEGQPALTFGPLHGTIVFPHTLSDPRLLLE